MIACSLDSTFQCARARSLAYLAGESPAKEGNRFHLIASLAFLEVTISNEA